MKAYDNYIFDLYGTLVDIHTEENDPLVWKKLALFYGYYDADYSSEELKERYAAIIAGEEYKMKSEKKDDAHEAHPEVQIEEVFQKLFEEKGVKADPTLGIAKYFDDIFISSTCGVKKPDSRFFQLLIDKYNLDITKSIMIGNDGISDIAGAKSVGLDTFYIHSNISPKLPEETVILPDGTEKKRKIVPDADFVLDGMDMERVRELLLGE